MKKTGLSRFFFYLFSIARFSAAISLAKVSITLKVITVVAIKPTVKM